VLVVMAAVAYADPPAVDDCRFQTLGYASSPDGDQMLFSAAACFERAGAARRAVQTYDLLVRSYPKSQLAMKALSSSGLAAVGLARFEDAAVRYEEYARRYTGENDARRRMDSAIRLRIVIGDQRGAKADIDFYVKTWGASAPKDTAAAMLALANLYETPGERSKALRAYVKQFGAVVDRDQLAIAYGRLGEALWQSSCPVTAVDGLCIQLGVDRRRDTCDANEPRAAVVTRKQDLRKEALATFERAVKLVADGKLEDSESRHALATAKLRLADDELELAMQTTFPADLDFTAGDREKARRSRQRFDAWLKAEMLAAQKVREKYEAVIAIKDPETSVAAVARTAEVVQSFRRKLVTSDVPKRGLRAKEVRAAYCGALLDAAEPIAQVADRSFGVCAAKATELGVYNETVQLCLREVLFIEDEVVPPVTLALPELDALRALPAKDARRTQIAAEIQERAENALALSQDQRPYVVLAMLALETGKPKLVARAYMGLAFDDKNPLVQAGRAVVAGTLGDWGTAATASAQASALAPKNADFMHLAVMIDLHLGRWQSASERLDLLGDGYDELVARAIIARALGDPQHAEQLYQRAIAIDGTRPEAHFDLGLLYELHTNPRDPGRASDERKRAQALGLRHP